MASWLQVKPGLRPLDRVRSEISRIRSSRIDRLSRNYPAEIAPLAEEVNKLLDPNADTLERVRAG